MGAVTVAGSQNLFDDGNQISLLDGWILTVLPAPNRRRCQWDRKGGGDRGEWQLLSVFISYFPNYHSLPQYITVSYERWIFFFCKKHFALGSRIVFFPPKSFSTSLSSSDSLVLILEFILIAWFYGHEKIKLFKWRIRSETKCLIW